MRDSIIYSFVVDENPKFSYQAWHLAKSIENYCAASVNAINIQCTANVPDRFKRHFLDQGYKVRELQPFGDRTFCNKLSQLPNLADEDCDLIVLLDTDMIATGDCRTLLVEGAVQAKVVDFANPKLEVLKQIIAQAGGQSSAYVTVEANTELTLLGNANGGFYGVPKALSARFSEEWRRWATWLFENDGILSDAGRMKNVDQVSAAMAFLLSGVPYAKAPSNLNYYLHHQGSHKYFDESKPLCFVHYHDSSLNAAGLIEPVIPLNVLEATTISAANSFIARNNIDNPFQSFIHA